MGRRPGRAAAKNAAAALKNTPQTYEDVDDEPMQDSPASDAGTPQDPDDEDNEDDVAGTPADSEAASAPNTPQPEPEQTVVRRKKLGRPPKNRPADWDSQDVERDGSETGTPAKRGRGRGGGFGRGGGRWARKGGPSHVTQQPVDKEGNLMNVIDDELDLPEDEEGETKVDKMGNLQGGRDYRCRTFTVLGRGSRLYMLSTEPARCVGFRDSYLFFTKHKRLYKIIIDDDEKRDMIDRELIPHSYKGRAIGIVTARSVFREFGAQIIVGGKRVIDDYEVTKAREAGVVEGELADPNDVVKLGEVYNKNQYVAWHGASSVYHSGAPTVPLQNGKIELKKKKIVVTDENWMLEHALTTSKFNSRLTEMRRQNLAGVYDVHTNVLQYPKIMQPTHARWEQINDNLTQLSITPPRSGHETANNNIKTEQDTIFTSVDPIISRNLLVVDTIYENPPHSNLGIPGPDGDSLDLGFNGLSSVSEEMKDCLPPECREAFENALMRELQWKTQFGAETRFGHRRLPIIDKGMV